MDKRIRYCPCCGLEIDKNKNTHCRDEDRESDIVICSKEKLEVHIDIRGFAIWNPKP